MISRAPHGLIGVMFGPVDTTETHLAFSGARIHSSNTAEMTAMFEALSFLGPRGPVAHEEQSRILKDSMHAASICLGTIQARTHVLLARACQQSMILAQHKLRLTMQHVFGYGADHALHLAHSDSHLATMLTPAGFIITLTLPCVLMAVTTSVTSWNDCNAFEQMQHHLLNIRISIVFTIEVIVFNVHLTRTSGCSVCSCSQPSSFRLGHCFLEQVMESLSSTVSTVPSFDDYFEHNMWNPVLELLFLGQANGIFGLGQDRTVLSLCS